MIKEAILEIRKNVSQQIYNFFPNLSSTDNHHLAAYIVSSTCCFNRYRCYVEMEENARNEIGRKREVKYVAVLCEKKVQGMGYSVDFDSCLSLSRIMISDYSQKITDIYFSTFPQNFKETYILKIAEFLSLTNTGGSEGNYEAAWSLLSVLNNIEKNNEKWAFWHIHGIIKEKINYFNRNSVFDDSKIVLLDNNEEFLSLIKNAMEEYKKASDIIIWIANND